MTKRDYVAIAACVKRQMIGWTIAECNDALLGIKGVADELCDVFTADNPRFDRAKFLKACGISD